MVDTTEFIDLNKTQEEKKSKLATVTDIFENGTAKVKFLEKIHQAKRNIVICRAILLLLMIPYL